MDDLFPFRLDTGFVSARVHSVQSVRYEYARFLNLELKSDFHFLYLATVFRQHHRSLALVLAAMRAQYFLYLLLLFKKESVLAEQFVYVKHALQYMNGHADSIRTI